MKIGVVTALYNNLSLDDMLAKAKSFGLDYVEIGTGGYPGDSHCDMAKLLESKDARKEFMAKISDAGLKISAFSCHCNPVHPNKAVADAAKKLQDDTIKLASELEVGVINTFSGCPGGSPEDTMPNWVTCAWPPDYAEALKYQWEEVLIPYWQKEGAAAKAAGVKFAFEMHPGFAVYNVATMLRMREACGDGIGCNFDPSHLFWNGVDPVAAIKALGSAIYHVHAKDCALDKSNIAVNGCNDTTPYGKVLDRSWTFRTVGYGHGPRVWRDIISTLRLVGYDYVLSIEHEDVLMSVDEGLGKAVNFLRNCVIDEPAPEMWWA